MFVVIFFHIATNFLLHIDSDIDSFRGFYFVNCFFLDCYITILLWGHTYYTTSYFATDSFSGLYIVMTSFLDSYIVIASFLGSYIIIA